MWWYLVKQIDNTDNVIYTYGRETLEQSGILSYNKITKEFIVVKLADNDTEKSANKLLPHLHRMIFQENCPDKRQIAIG